MMESTCSRQGLAVWNSGEDTDTERGRRSSEGRAPDPAKPDYCLNEQGQFELSSNLESAIVSGLILCASLLIISLTDSAGAAEQWTQSFRISDSWRHQCTNFVVIQVTNLLAMLIRDFEIVQDGSFSFFFFL